MPTLSLATSCQVSRLCTQINASDTVYDFYVDELTGTWSHWESHLRGPQLGIQCTSFSEMVVPTIDSVRFRHLLLLSRTASKARAISVCCRLHSRCTLTDAPFRFTQAPLLIGGPGTAKTTIVTDYLNHIKSNHTAVKTMTFSHFTAPEVFQKTVEVLKIHVYSSLPAESMSHDGGLFAGLCRETPRAHLCTTERKDFDNIH